MTAPRDYADIARRVESLARRPDTDVDIIGSVEGLPVHRVIRRPATTRRRLLLTGGLHGDEPAGIESVFHILESIEAPPGLELVAAPCLNPTGYVRDTRENYRGVDINRSFEADEEEEVRIIKGFLDGQRFDCLVDFHEDWEATGFYMYETCKNGAAEIGAAIIERVEAVMAIDPDGEESDDSDPVSRGVLCVQESWGLQGMITYVAAYHTPHAVMFETPSAAPLETRVAAHLAAFNKILEHLS